MKNKALLDHLDHVPNQPGVYLFYNDKDQVIYVGKAKDLKKRLSVYFHQAKRPIKVQKMVEKIHHFDYILLNSESEALLLESDLIKKYHPRYNVLLRDDKSYPYLILNTQHRFPRLMAYRGERTDKKLDYYGPYANASIAKKTLDTLQRLFKLRQCSDHEFKSRRRPCLQYQIKRCSAPCVQFISEDDYDEHVSQVKHYLSGQQQTVINLFVDKMHTSSENKAYEMAAYYRDQVRLLQKLRASSYPIPFQTKLDIITVQSEGDRFAAYCFSFRHGHCLGGYFFTLLNETGSLVETVLTAFILQYYTEGSHRDLPEKLVVPQGVSDEKALIESLKKRLGKKIVLQKQLDDALEAWYMLGVKNAKQALKQYNTENCAEKVTALSEALSIPIQRIECFDISHTQGSETIGSCVVFNEHGPDKRAYRAFKIQGIEPGDDYAAMAQVITRRYQRLVSQGETMPDVIIIDGGLGQLKEAVNALESLAIDLSQLVLLAIAKGPSRKSGGETVYRHGESEPIHLTLNANAFLLIQFIRDESHRYALKHHRHRRQKRAFESILESIEGIGKKKRKCLLDHFGGLEEIKEALPAELAKVPGISDNLAKSIFEHFRTDLS